MNIVEFYRLFQPNTGISFPVLIELRHPEKITWYFTSDNRDIYWNDIWYTAVPMSYKFPSSRDGVPQGGTLEIDIDQQHGNYELLRWFDEADHRAYMVVTALINEQGDIMPYNHLVQRHGNVTWDGEKISWQLGADDRMNMQVNPYVFSTDALLG